MITEEKTEETTFVLTAMDRCDSCRAQAYVWVNGVTGDLLFCGHHFSKWESKIREFAFEVVDEREKLNENRLVGDHT